MIWRIVTGEYPHPRRRRLYANHGQKCPRLRLCLREESQLAQPTFAALDATIDPPLGGLFVFSVPRRDITANLGECSRWQCRTAKSMVPHIPRLAEGKARQGSIMRSSWYPREPPGVPDKPSRIFLAARFASRRDAVLQ